MFLNRVLTCIVLVCFSVVAMAQVNPVPGDYNGNFEQGNKLIEENNWPMALKFFQEAYKVDSTNANINYKMGVCYLNSFSEKQKSLYYLRFAVRDLTRNYDPYSTQVKKAPENAYYFLAQAYHYNYQFDSAISFFESWKSVIGTRDPAAARR